MGNLINLIKKDLRYEEALHACMNCGMCTAVCPAAEFYDYDPRRICDLVQRHRFSEFSDSQEYARRIKDIGFTYVRGMMTIDTIRRYEEHETEYGILLNEMDNK